MCVFLFAISKNVLVILMLKNGTTNDIYFVADCDLSSSSSITLSSTTTTTTTTTSPFCLERNGLFPNEANCSSFYQCSEGKAHLVACPPGLHFSDKHKTCEYPCDAKCDSTMGE